MKRLDNMDQLEALFKAKLEQAEVPAPDVWSDAIASSGVTGGSGLMRLGRYFSSLTNVAKVALFAGGITAAGILLYRANTPVSTENVTGPNVQELRIEPGTQAHQGELGQSAGDPEALVPQEFNEEVSSAPQQTYSQVPSNAQAAQELRQPVSTQTTQPQSGQETVLRGDGVQLHNAAEISIESMGHRACVGETRTFGSSDHRTGDWYINGQLVKEQSDVMSHRFSSPGKYDISVRSEGQMASYPLEVNGFDGQVLVTKQLDGRYELRLSKAETQVKRWVMAGEVISTDQILNTTFHVGKNFVQVEFEYAGCTISQQKVIEIKGAGSFSSPNIFTPNGDGLNDEYLVDISHYSAFYLQVIDGRNQRVFSTSDPAKGWNGINGSTGKECPEGVYQVIVKYQLEGESEQTEYVKLTLKR